MSKNNMKQTAYYQSGRHTENFHKARKLATLAQKIKLDEKINKYVINPTLCHNCTTPLPYKKKTNKFCSKSCSASFNNHNRPPRSEASKKKTSETMKKLISTNSKPKTLKKYCIVSFHPCSVCQKLITFNSSKPTRKTCSRECQIHASVGNRTYTNGRRLNIHYYNSFINQTVLLESSWELQLAEWLDLNNLYWIRPKPIKWFDDISNRIRLYYPDFYLPTLDLYLDPKNPTALLKSQHKMTIVSKLIKLSYGNVDDIKVYIIQQLK